jgi:ankyrin repeat protein
MRINSWASALVLLIFSLLVGCGKKAENKTKAHANSRSQTELEAQFSSLKLLREALKTNNAEAFRSVLKKNPAIDLDEPLRDSGETLLTQAIREDRFEIQGLLLENRADPAKTNLKLESPLIVAASEGRLQSVIALCKLRVDLELRDSNQDTALHVALKKGHDLVALELLKHGANLNALDGQRRDPVKLAERSNTKESLRFIRHRLDLELGVPDIKRFRDLIETTDYQNLEILLGRYPIIATDETYNAINPLALLVSLPNQLNALRTARVLLVSGASVDGASGTKDTPLIEATKEQKPAFAKLFLTFEAKTELLDSEGHSALIHAVKNNDLKMVKLLLAYSAVEKYTYWQDGRRVTVNACDVSRDVERGLKSDEERRINKEIKKNLGCRFLGGVF